MCRDGECLREKAAALFTGVKAHIDDYVRDSVCISKVGQAWATSLFGHSEEVEASSDTAAVSKSTLKVGFAIPSAANTRRPRTCSYGSGARRGRAYGAAEQKPVALWCSMLWPVSYPAKPAIVELE